MKNPLISFVVTCFNQRQFICETVDSVLAQTIPDIELILIDDGSSDGTSTLIQSYHDPRVSYTWQPNAGPSAATRAGIELARGEYIAFLGGDDVCLPQRAELQLKQITGSDYDIIFCIPRIIDSMSNDMADFFFPAFIGKEFKSMGELFRLFFFGGNFLCGPSGFTRRSFFQKYGNYKNGLIQLQDFELWVRACRMGAKIGVFGERLVKYRVRSDGKNLSGNSNVSRTSLELLSTYSSFFADAPFSLLRAAFPREIGLDAKERNLSVDVDLAFLYLSHSFPVVRVVGVELMIELFENPAAVELLGERGFGAKDLFRVMNEIDCFSK